MTQRNHKLFRNAASGLTALLLTFALLTPAMVGASDWEALDGIVWTPWGTILFAEERTAATIKDPEVPQAQAGLVYELYLDPHDPTKPDTSVNPTGATPGVVPRPAVGSRSHEGMRFDPQGNLYGISESSPPTGGYIYKFTPDRRGDLSSGQLYALRVTSAGGKIYGDDVWVAIPGKGNAGVAQATVRFATLTDCDAEPTGPYFDLSGKVLFVNVQHRSGDRLDLGVAVTRSAP